MQSISKLTDIFKISHDKNSYRRILDAINDVHIFYLLNTPTILCSCVEDWNYIDKNMYNIRLYISMFIQYFFIIYRVIILNIPAKYRSFVSELKIYNLLLQLSYKNYITMVHNYLVN